MKIYCCIDGTDNVDVSPDIQACLTLEGATRHRAGHVKRMQGLGFHAQKYFAGTQDSVTGASSSGIIDEAVAWIVRAWDGAKKEADKKVFLGGFSRGSAGMLVVAHRLEKQDIPVQEMYLFDAVDRSFWMDNSQTKKVPANVNKAFHALRDPKAGSRKSFGNCGLVGTNNNLEKAYFMTTHGGVGGWPNGQSKVKPGFGAEDFAYVATYGAAVGPHVAASDKRQNNIHENAEPWPTNISPAQEARGQAAAWRWMYSKAFSTLMHG